MTENEEQAIKFSIAGDWEAAIKVNLLILKKSPKDTDALNRLSYAYIQVGKLSLAKKNAERSLKIDPYNLIARKNISTLKNLSEKGASQTEKLENNVNFIENPGTTKLVSLICPASKAIICNIRNGAELQMKSRRRKMCVFHKEIYIGCFPDDLSHKYISYMAKGNKYELFFKSYNSKKISVLLVSKC